MGHEVSQLTVWRLLDELGYSMQSNRKTLQGAEHADRNAQFEYINESVKSFLCRGLPVISVDTKKKELIMFGIFRQARASGTRSSIVCSVISPRTGEAGL